MRQIKKRQLKKTGESISVWVGRWLIKKGYDLASCAGFSRLSSIESDAIGILIRRENDPKSQTSSVPGRRLFVGTLWFDNLKRGADRKNWILEVYGEKYFEPFQKLVRELWSTFNISIEVRLVLEQSATEICISDIDYRNLFSDTSPI